MKAARIAIILMAAALLVFGLSGAAFAFHNGGVGFCEGCHTMHNSVSAGTVASGTTGGSGYDFQMGSTNGGVTGWTGVALNTKNSANTAATGIVGNAVNQYLLRGSDPSSTCLNCHADSTGSPLYFQEMSKTGNAGQIQNPGGDFQWVNTTYTYTLVNPDLTTGTATSYGENHGHHVVAIDFGLGAAGTDVPGLSAAPGSNYGGTSTAPLGYPASNLACNSCHDPHGRATATDGKSVVGSGSYGATTTVAGGEVGAYRLLARAGYDPGGAAIYDPTATSSAGTYVGFPVQVNGSFNGGLTGFTYTAGAINAVAYGTGAAGDSWTENDATNAQHNVYNSGISEFCANCHNLLLNAGNTSGDSSHRHPAGDGAFMDLIYTNYNNYAGTGNLTAGNGGYWGLVPFELDNSTTPAQMVTATTSSTLKAWSDGNTGSSVMCLTCHRAHASAFDHDTRWDTYVTFLSDSSVIRSTDPGLGTYAATGAMYGSTLAANGSYQRQLCNKCHVQD